MFDIHDGCPIEISFDNEESGFLILALDVYSRIWVGQYEELLTSIDGMRGFFSRDTDTEWAIEAILQKVRELAIPHLKDSPMGGGLGIWSIYTDDRAMCAYDIQQVLRYERAWHLHPEGGQTVLFNSPFLHGSLPTVECVCSGDESDFKETVTMEITHAAIMAESLEVCSLCHLGRIGEVMTHFTDDRLAVILAGVVEPLLEKVASEKGRGTFGQGEPRLDALRSRLIELEGIDEAIDFVCHGRWLIGDSRSEMINKYEKYH